MRRIETYGFWHELLSLKDDLSLRELAEKFSVTPGAISAAFKRTGTARMPAPPGPRHLRPRGPLDVEVDEYASQRNLLARSPRELMRPGSKDHLLTSWREELGRVPDAEVAERAGVSVRTVAAYRARYAISAFSGPRRGRREEEDQHAWRVVIRHDGIDRDGVVLAATLSAAAARIDSPGRVLSITWLGELF